MKLNRADAVALNNLIAVVQLAGITSIVIDGEMASGMNTKNAAFISTSDIPKFGQKIGISQLSNLRQRLDLLVNTPEMFIDAKESERGEIVQLEMVAGKNKVQFRCTATALIKAPKKINDTPIFKVNISKDQLATILASVKVMSAKQLTLKISKDGVVIFETMDANNDRFTVELNDKITYLENIDADDLGTVVNYYNTDILTALMRAASTDDGVSFGIGEGGTISLQINQHNLFVFSQVDGD